MSQLRQIAAPFVADPATGLASAPDSKDSPTPTMRCRAGINLGIRKALIWQRGSHVWVTTTMGRPSANAALPSSRRHAGRGPPKATNGQWALSRRARQPTSGPSPLGWQRSVSARPGARSQGHRAIPGGYRSRGECSRRDGAWRSSNIGPHKCRLTGRRSGTSARRQTSPSATPAPGRGRAHRAHRPDQWEAARWFLSADGEAGNGSATKPSSAPPTAGIGSAPGAVDAPPTPARTLYPHRHNGVRASGRRMGRPGHR